MDNFIPTLKYMILTCKHKFFVFWTGLRLDVPILQLLTHDLSKFTPSEAPHYGRQFFGDESDPSGFLYAWARHQNRNKHHWEHWITEPGHVKDGYVDHKASPMPEQYVREMIADWISACRAYEGYYPKYRSEWPWLQENLPVILERVHPETAFKINWVLEEHFMSLKRIEENYL